MKQINSGMALLHVAKLTEYPTGTIVLVVNHKINHDTCGFIPNAQAQGYENHTCSSYIAQLRHLILKDYYKE